MSPPRGLIRRRLKDLRMAVKNPAIEAICALATAGLDRRVRDPEDLDRDPPRCILLIRCDRIGDLLACSPLIAALHARWPEARLSLVGGPRNRAVMPLLPYLERAPVEFERHPGSWVKLRRWLHRQSFDLALSLRSEVLSGALLAAWSKAPVRAVANASRTLPAFNLVLGPHDHHNLRRYWRAAWRLGVTWPEPRPIVTLPEWAERAVAQLWPRLGLEGATPVVGVGIPNRSTRRHAFKAWPALRIEQLVRQLLADGLRVVLFGVAAERREAEALQARVPGLLVAPPMSLAEVGAFQRRLALLVSPLTGTLHLADGVGTPTVAIGESRNAADWRPLGAQHRVVAAPVPAAIPLETVLEAARAGLAAAGVGVGSTQRPGVGAGGNSGARRIDSGSR